MSSCPSFSYFLPLIIFSILFITVFSDKPSTAILESPLRSSSFNYYIDGVIGSDSNDGSFEAPFKTFGPLQNISDLDLPDSSFNIFLSPGEYLVSHFIFSSYTPWVFKTCEVCPGGHESDIRAILRIMAPIDPPLDFLGVFQSDLTRDMGSEPMLQFVNIEFKPSGDDSFTMPIFWVELSGLRMEGCLVSHFRHEYSLEDEHLDAYGVIGASASHILLLQSTFQNNSLILSLENEGAKSTIPMFGQSTAWMIIENSNFSGNSIVSPGIQGGLMACQASMVIKGSSFISNSGYITKVGDGMVLGVTGNCFLKMTDTQFIENQFEVLESEWDGDLVGAYGATYGAAVGISPTVGEVDIQKTRFIGNVATQGGAIAVGMGLLSEESRYTGVLGIYLSDCYFERNNGTSGIGAAILLQGSNLGTFESHNLVFDSNMGGESGTGYKLYPGVPISQADPMDSSLIFGIELSSPSASLSFHNLSFSSQSSSQINSLLSSPSSPSFNQEKVNLHENLSSLDMYDKLIHRIIISGVNKVNFTSLRYLNIEPADNSATASLLALSDIWSHAIIDNIIIDCIIPPIASRSPIWKPWNPGPFIFLDDQSKNSIFSISRLFLGSWPHGTFHLSILVARGMDHLSIEHSQILNTAHTTDPLILIENCGSVSLSHLHIRNFTGGIQISNSNNVRFENTYFSDYAGNTAMIQLDRIFNETFLLHFFAHNGTAPFLSHTSFGGLTIQSSLLESATITSSGGAINLVQGSSFTASNLTGSSINAIQGAVLSATLVKTITITQSSFNLNQASQTGGVIYSDSCSVMSIDQCQFSHNTALNGGGGALTATCFVVDIFNSSFHASKASTSGGAIAVDSGFGMWSSLSTTILRNVNFSENHAQRDGGAISSSLTSITATNSSFSSNSAGGQGGAIRMEVTITEFNQARSFLGCTFFNNSAIGLGGALSFSTTEVDPFPASISIVESRFLQNTAYFGGAIASEFIFSFADGTNDFIDNSASYGGCLWLQKHPESDLPEIQNQTFQRNRCGFTGDVLAILGSSLPGTDASEVWMRELMQENRFIDQPSRTSLFGLPLVYLPVEVVLLEEENVLLGVGNGRSSVRSGGEEIVIGTFFPGVSRSFEVDLKDQLGQSGVGVNNSLLQVVTQLVGCYEEDGSEVSIIQLSQSFHLSMESDDKALTGGTSKLVMSWLFSLSPVSDGEKQPLERDLICEILFETVFTKDILRAKVTPCGFGTGLSKHTMECQECPLGSYSLQGKCFSCSEDPHVTCFSGSILPVPNYWVDLSLSLNQYQVLRCPNGFCSPITNQNKFNPCSPSRMGPLCGKCRNGLQESIISQCIPCNKPNWIMILLAITVLWISVLILHSLLAVSSGKATILIFFIQSSFIINYQISISDIFRSNATKDNSSIPAPIAWILCLMPLNSLHRTLLLGMVPFIMILMLSITFTIRYIASKVFSSFLKWRSSPSSYQRLTSQESSHIFDPSIIVTYDAVDDSGIDQDEDFIHSHHIELQTDHSEDENDVSGASDFEFGSIDGFDGEGIEEDGKNGKNGKSRKSVPVGEEMVIKRMDEQEEDRMEEVYKWQQQMVFWHPYRMIRTILSLLAGSFSSVLGIAISTMDCVSLLSGERVLHSAPSIECDSREFKLFRNLNGLWVPYMVILFVGLLWKLVDGYRKNVLSSMDVRFGVWYEMYKPKMFAWRLTEMIRRLILSLIAKLLLSSPLKRSVSLFAISVAFLSIHLLTMPYRQKLENFLETLSLSALAFISLVDIWNAQLLGLPSAPKATFVLAWATCFIVAASIVGAILFVKVKAKTQTR